MRRHISILIRNIQSLKSDRQLISTFYKWEKQLKELSYQPINNPQKKLLLIRLDDIGDYLLFQNFLSTYKNSQYWKDFQITYLGNETVRPAFELQGNSIFENTMWIDKKLYFKDGNYRMAIWENIRNQHFDCVINPSRTRPLHLDDLCMLSAKSNLNYAAENTFRNQQINTISNNYYQYLFPHNEIQHEFHFNKSFAEWCTGLTTNYARPSIDEIENVDSYIQKPFILLCIGSAHKSRRWPQKRWIELIKLIQQNGLANTIICGSAKEIDFAEKIATATKSENLTGATSFEQMAKLVSNANVAICNDSMAAHLAVSFNKPSIIISNGNNFPRFTTYSEAGNKNTTTIYASPFLKEWKKRGEKPFWHYTPVTKDMETISASKVFEELRIKFKGIQKNVNYNFKRIQ